MAASAPQDEEYEESTDFSWTKKAFELLESDALHCEVVSREQVVRSRVWGPCPRCGHPLDDRQTHTAVANLMGGTQRSRNEKPAFSDGKGLRYFRVDVSCGSTTATPARRLSGPGAGSASVSSSPSRKTAGPVPRARRPAAELTRSDLVLRVCFRDRKWSGRGW